MSFPIVFHKLAAVLQVTGTALTDNDEQLLTIVALVL